jgi:hypothetical protein
MIGYLKRLTIRNIVSPYGLAILSYLVFLFAWSFPPGLYTQYVNEPDLMFLEPFTLIFYTGCVAAFLVGVRASRFFAAPVQGNAGRDVFASSPLLYLLPPLLAAASFSAIYLVKMGGKINFVALLASQQGNAIKAAGGAGQMSEGRWDESVPLLTVVLWWSLYRALQLRLRGAAKAIFFVLFLLSTALGILVGVATVNRANLMPIILGLIIVYVFPRTRTTNAKVVKLALTAAMGAAGAVGTFLFLSFLRGALGLNLLVTGLLGYTIVSYNRMTALLTGVMHYAYEGRGVYLNPFLLSDEKVNYLFHLTDRFGWPTSLGLWQTEFSSTTAAGLNPAFIWAGAFGYVYSDIGWAAPLYWCVIGVIAGWLWAKFSAGKSVGLVLYPWVAFSILMWCGPNFIFRTNFVQYCEFALVLHIYDKVFLRRSRETSYDTNGAVAPEHITPFFGPVSTGLDRGLF